MSTAVATRTHSTPEDLLAMPDGKSYELIQGQLVERNIGIESSWVGTRLLARLERFCEQHDSGWTLQADSGYQCFPHDPEMVRKPDASFVRRGRFPGNLLPKGWATIPPDLAVEVVSPNDRVSELEEKLGDYRKAGVPLVWVIYPESRTVMVHRRDGSVSRLLDHEELLGEDVLPGFRCPVREVLPPQAKLEEKHAG
jgi:Uma2 family endonuclease